MNSSSTQRVWTLPATHVGVLEQVEGEAGGRLDPLDAQVAQRPAGALQRRLAVGAADDQLAPAASRSKAGSSSPGSRRCRRGRRCPPGPPTGSSVPGEGAKSRAGDSALIRTSIAWPRDLDLLLGDREPLAAGDPQLLADDVDAGDHLGDRVLDLQAGVDLEEAGGCRGRGRRGTRRWRRRRSRGRAIMRRAASVISLRRGSPGSP